MDEILNRRNVQLALEELDDEAIGKKILSVVSEIN